MRNAGYHESSVKDPMQALRDALVAYTSDVKPATSVYPTASPKLQIIRGDLQTPLQHAFYEPALIVVVQGAKALLLGDARFTYAAGNYLVVTLGLPVLASITAASAEHPYLALALTIDLHLLHELLGDVDPAARRVAPPGLGLLVGTLEARPAAALARLGELLATPPALRALYPALKPTFDGLA